MEWKEKNGALYNEMHFTSQTEMMRFLTQVAKAADTMNHHPDITIRNAFQLELSIYTHDEDQITDKDYILASKIEGLLLVECVGIRG